MDSQAYENNVSIILYKNSSEFNRLDKTNYLTIVKTINGVMRDEFSLINTSIVIEYNGTPNFNYLYVSNFNRYYFVNDITSLRNNLWDISIQIDVLMTYKDTIKNCTCFIDRVENNYNPLITDDNIPLYQGEVITNEFIPNDVFDTTRGQYILTGFLLRPVSTTNLTIEDINTLDEYVETTENVEVVTNE